MPTDLDAVVAANLQTVRARIVRAARGCGREPGEVTLVAVSKTFSAGHVAAAAAAGQQDFGENKVQEALDKMPRSPAGVKWHLIGHLQSNKSKKAVGGFQWIHSIDSVGLLRRVDAAATEQGVAPILLVQVDLAGEATKFGAAPEDVSGILDEAERARAVRIAGLMTLPPWSEDGEHARPYFRRLYELRERLGGATVLPQLSMGMSHDFEVAIQEGATLVRVGTAIFGRRTKPEVVT